MHARTHARTHAVAYLSWPCSFLSGSNLKFHTAMVLSLLPVRMLLRYVQIDVMRERCALGRFTCDKTFKKIEQIKEVDRRNNKLIKN